MSCGCPLAECKGSNQSPAPEGCRFATRIPAEQLPPQISKATERMARRLGASFAPHEYNPRTAPGGPDHRETMPANPKAIHGARKPSLALVPAGALIPTAKVFELGAAKYGPFNWRKDPVEAMTYANACLRHLYSWIDGCDQDAESGQSDLAHGIACLSILLDAMANGTMIDDRPHKGTAADLIAALTKTA